MRCAKLHDALRALIEGQDPGAGLREDLVKLGMAYRAGRAGAPEELERLKAELLSVREELSRLRGMRDGLAPSDLSPAELEARVRQTAEREALLRGNIVRLVGSTGLAPASGGIAPTYRGREALLVISARLPAAANLEWNELSARVERLRLRLGSESREASDIFKRISDLVKPEEHHVLRSAAVGLASVPGEPPAKAEAFSKVMKLLRTANLDVQYAAVGAEVAVARAAEGGQDAGAQASEMASEAASLSRMQGLTVEEKMVLPVLLLALPPSERDGALAGALEARERLGNALGPALLQLGSPDREELRTREEAYWNWLGELGRGRSPIPADAVVASALLATSRGDAGAIRERFSQARNFLASLFEEDLDAASAVVALWPSGLEESLDNIRLAASEILQNRLSLGGMENFSLGMKLLSNNAEFASLSAVSGPPDWMRSGAPGPIPRAGMAAAEAMAASTAVAASAAGSVLLSTPLLARTPFTLFHSLTIQGQSFRHYRFHPVHSHYLYG